jgi:hypothetical protein
MVFDPVSLIGQFAINIVKFARSLHTIHIPASIIHAPIIIIEFSFTMPHTFKLLTFVSGPLSIGFLHVLQLNWRLYRGFCACWRR